MIIQVAKFIENCQQKDVAKLVQPPLGNKIWARRAGPKFYFPGQKDTRKRNQQARALLSILKVCSYALATGETPDRGQAA